MQSARQNFHRLTHPQHRFVLFTVSRHQPLCHDGVHAKGDLALQAGIEAVGRQHLADGVIGLTGLRVDVGNGTTTAGFDQL